MVKISEFELIEKINRAFPNHDKNVIGIGDDAAVISIPDKKKELITTDTMINGVHFLSEKADFEKLGFKSMAVNISDIAAMGGYPLYALLTLGISDKINDSQIDGLLRGINNIRNEFPFELIGGDIVKSDVFFISITMIGEPFKNPIMRSGAKENDFIYVSGTIGDSGIGLAIEKEIIKYDILTPAFFLERHYKPSPRVDLIEYLTKNHSIHSCIDISDGLLQDLGHISEMSGIGFELEIEKIPISRDKIGSLVLSDERYFLEFGLSGGEDYELIFTSPEAVALPKAMPLVTQIGRMTGNSAVLRYKGKEISPKELKKGFTHF
jgi:thiamine-monophosphate kinase